MTAATAIPILALAALLVPLSFVQLLYLEALRLRGREGPAFDYFKEVLEDRVGLKLDQGALAFSLLKHTAFLLLVIAIFASVQMGGAPLWQCLLETAGAGWVSMVVLTHVAPQLLYLRTRGEWIIPLLPLLRILLLLLSPLLVLLRFLQSLAELGDEAPREEEAASPAEDIEALIDAGTEEGLIEEGDRKLIHSVVAFGDKTVREVMTPRPNIVAIGQGATLEELRQLVIHEQFSRIPVYEDSIDQICGFVHVRDMFERDHAERAARKVKEVARPMRFVPETKPVRDLLREMQADGSHMAVVVDEYGNTAGIATMEDLLEEILGEIRDEHEPGADVHRDADGSYVVAGSLDVDRLDELLEYRPGEETESTTIAGLAAEWLGRVPRAGETVERDGLRIEVLAGNDRRVSQVRISRAGLEKHGAPPKQ